MDIGEYLLKKLITCNFKAINIVSNKFYESVVLGNKINKQYCFKTLNYMEGI